MEAVVANRWGNLRFGAHTGQALQAAASTKNVKFIFPDRCGLLPTDLAHPITTVNPFRQSHGSVSTSEDTSPAPAGPSYQHPDELPSQPKRKPKPKPKAKASEKPHNTATKNTPSRQAPSPQK